MSREQQEGRNLPKAPQPARDHMSVREAQRQGKHNDHGNESHFSASLQCTRLKKLPGPPALLLVLGYARIAVLRALFVKLLLLLANEGT